MIWRPLEVLFGYEYLVHRCFFSCFHPRRLARWKLDFIVDHLLRERGSGSGKKGIQFFRDSGFPFIAFS
jgi:hypothetical protein